MTNILQAQPIRLGKETIHNRQTKRTKHSEDDKNPPRDIVNRNRRNLHNRKMHIQLINVPIAYPQERIRVVATSDG
jgi:hypothetical protein